MYHHDVFKRKCTYVLNRLVGNFTNYVSSKVVCIPVLGVVLQGRTGPWTSIFVCTCVRRASSQFNCETVALMARKRHFAGKYENGSGRVRRLGVQQVAANQSNATGTYKGLHVMQLMSCVLYH